MLTINLEKEMISGKKKDSSTELAVKEVNNLLQNLQDTDKKVLERLGMTHNITIVNNEIEKSKELQPFDSQRIFHINEIGKICRKYHLRFLPTDYYKGSIDPLLATKVIEFEEKHHRNSYSRGLQYHICAPASSFALQERSIDPLCFAKINDEYYYLVHKWGNDLSWSRAITGLVNRPYIRFWVPLIILSLLLAHFINSVHIYIPAILIVFIVIQITCSIARAESGNYEENRFTNRFK